MASNSANECKPGSDGRRDDVIVVVTDHQQQEQEQEGQEEEEEGRGRLFVLRGRVPHPLLLPRCDAVVHHGGAGTTATVLRAGRACMVGGRWYRWYRWLVV